MGKSVANALPEVAAQGFIALLDRVAETKQPYTGRSVPSRSSPIPAKRTGGCST